MVLHVAERIAAEVLDNATLEYAALGHDGTLGHCICIKVNTCEQHYVCIYISVCLCVLLWMYLFI
jgi:hypothetical protein